MKGRSVSGAPRPRRWQRRVLLGAWCGAVVLVTLTVVRISIGWVFPIASGSMVPTLRPGEWVFLRWDRSEPKRFELVVFRSEGGDAVVKRVWGLPRERVLIEPAGDVRIESELVHGEGRPALIPVFDSRLHSIGQYWNHGGTEHDPWRLVETGPETGPRTGPGGEVWEIDSREVPERLDASLLRHHAGVHDDYIDDKGQIRYGTVTVHDLKLGADCFVVEGGGRLRFELREQGDRLEFSLEIPAEGGPAQGVVRRRRGESKVDHAVGTFEVPLGRWFHVDFANIDDELVAEVDGAPALRCQYRQNTPHTHDRDADGQVDDAQVSLGERAFLGADRALVRFRGLTLARDIHVPAVGTFGVGREERLRDDELFVLGDDPPHSQDSREIGPVPTSRIIGRPLFVIWPPSAWRRVQR